MENHRKSFARNLTDSKLNSISVKCNSSRTFSWWVNSRVIHWREKKIIGDGCIFILTFSSFIRFPERLRICRCLINWLFETNAVWNPWRLLWVMEQDWRFNERNGSFRCWIAEHQTSKPEIHIQSIIQRIVSHTFIFDCIIRQVQIFDVSNH